MLHYRSVNMSMMRMGTVWRFCIGLVLLISLNPAGTSGAFTSDREANVTALERRSETRIDAGTFLVAAPDMKDPRFFQAVILMVQHDLAGSAGVVINRPSELELAKHLFPGQEKKLGSERFVFWGGPVALQEMVCLMQLKEDIPGTKQIFGDVYITSSRRVLDQFIGTRGPDNLFRIYMGYAGWSAGQLAAEIAQGRWQVMPADAKTIFETPADEIWSSLMRDREADRISI